MKTFKSTVLLVAVAGVLSAAAQAQPQSPTNASWGAYRSIVNPSVAVDDSFNRTTNNSVSAKCASKESKASTRSPRWSANSLCAEAMCCAR